MWDETDVDKSKGSADQPVAPDRLHSEVRREQADTHAPREPTRDTDEDDAREPTILVQPECKAGEEEQYRDERDYELWEVLRWLGVDERCPHYRSKVKTDKVNIEEMRTYCSL